MKKWFHVLGAVGLAALSAAVPAVSDTVAAHPRVSSALLLAYAVLGNLLKSPLKSQE